MSTTILAPERGLDPIAAEGEIVYYDENGRAVGTGPRVPLYITISDAMALTNLSRDTLWRMRRADQGAARLPFVQLGRKVLIPLAAIKALVDSDDYSKTRARSQQRQGWPERRNRRTT